MQTSRDTRRDARPPARPARVGMLTPDPWDVEADPADWPADVDNWLWEPTGGGDDEPSPDPASQPSS